MPRRRGFTLIELMIVVAIIGLLAAVAMPKFADMIRKAREGSGKANLGSMRSALSIYYGELEGQFPSDDLNSLVVDFKFFGVLPDARAPNYHPNSNGVVTSTGLGGLNDAGGWLYVNDATALNWGTVWVNCSHTDTRGIQWTEF